MKMMQMRMTTTTTMMMMMTTTMMRLRPTLMPAAAVRYSAQRHRVRRSCVATRRVESRRPLPAAVPRAPANRGRACARPSIRAATPRRRERGGRWWAEAVQRRRRRRRRRRWKRKRTRRTVAAAVARKAAVWTAAAAASSAAAWTGWRARPGHPSHSLPLPPSSLSLSSSSSLWPHSLSLLWQSGQFHFCHRRSLETRACDPAPTRVRPPRAF